MEILVILSLIGFVIFLALIKWIVETLVAKVRGKGGGREGALVPAFPAHNGADAPEYEPDKRSVDEALAGWLEAHYDEAMWWKEFLHHEGTGNRTPEEEERARERYAKEMKRLAEAESAKKKESVTRWMAQGLTEQQAEQRWRDMASGTHRASRLRYALQKD